MIGATASPAPDTENHWQTRIVLDAVEVPYGNDNHLPPGGIPLPARLMGGGGAPKKLLESISEKRSMLKISEIPLDYYEQKMNKQVNSASRDEGTS